MLPEEKGKYIYKSKVGDRSRGGPKGSLFDSYFIKVYNNNKTFTNE